MVLTAGACRSERTGPAATPYTQPTEAMDAAVSCATAGPHKTVLLVHGTGQTPASTWGLGYTAMLVALDYRVCTIALPGRATGDMRVSAEYVARAIERLSTNGQLDVVAHSQGGLLVRRAVSTFTQAVGGADTVVELGTPNHGSSWFTDLCRPSECRPAEFQMQPGSTFITSLNDGGEAKGGARYVSIWSRADQLVQPAEPPTAALMGATNLALEDVCPGVVVTHDRLLSNAVAVAAVVDALTHRDGPSRERLSAVPCDGADLPGFMPAVTPS
jgi:triacylglycerol esterase/lipase EstA (alpha/beta hydrolase family)